MKDYVSLEKLKELTRSEKKPKVARRIQVIILAIQGYTATAIALSLSLSSRSCQQWVQRFNQQGLLGLQDQAGRGRKPMLSAEQNRAFKKRLDAGPTKADRVCTFRGEDLRRILEVEFGKVCSLGTVYYQQHQMGYESLAHSLEDDYNPTTGTEVFSQSVASSTALTSISCSCFRRCRVFQGSLQR